MNALTGSYRLRAGERWIAPAYPGWRLSCLRGEAELFDGSLTRAALSAASWVEARGLVAVFEPVEVT